jgi:hypothetical protein
MSIHTILTDYEVFLVVIFVKDLEKQSIHLEESNHCFSIVLEIRLLNEGFLNALARFKAHTDRTRFGNATRIFSFQKQIKPSTDKKFTRYADQIAKIAEEVPNI